MSRKKILIIHETLNTGGAEKVLLEILSHFDKSAYDVDLLLMEGYGVYQSQVPEGIDIYSLHKGKITFFHRLILHLPEAVNRKFQKRWIERTLPRQHYDVIISFMEGVAFRLHSLILDKGDKNISWVHIDMDKSRWSQHLFPYSSAAPFYNMLDGIVFVSDGARAAFSEVFPEVNKDSLKVIYNIQNPDDIREKGSCKKIERDKNKFIISCVGRLEQQKRFDRVVDIAEMAKEGGYPFEFWILGQGSLLDELKAYSASKGVEDMVKFLGFQSNPYCYMKASDLFLLTSESEGYALVVGEAMSLGIPVISTKVVGPLDLLKNGEGILCEGDPRDLFNAIVKLYDSPELRAEYSRRGLEKSRDFNPEKTMSEIYSLL